MFDNRRPAELVIALAGMAGGALLMLFYAVLIVRQALDWEAGPTLGTPIHVPLMRVVSSAVVLLIVGLLGLLWLAVDRLSWTTIAGALLTLAGFGLWAYAAAENFTPLPEPAWAHPLLFPTLIALGSLALGAGAFQSRVLPRGAAWLLSVFGVLGMALLATVEDPMLRSAGFAAMLAYGAGWVWVGYGVWRPTAAR